ncbi:MAG: hypothetical protein AAF243_02355 [Cyanobacteria bacterium P01_A01_bin.137]
MTRSSLTLAAAIGASLLAALPAQANSFPAGALPDSLPQTPVSLSCHDTIFGDFIPDKPHFGTTNKGRKQYSFDTKWVATASDGTTATLQTIQVNNNSGSFLTGGTNPDVFFQEFVDPQTGFVSPKLTEQEGSPGDSWVLEIEYSRPIGNARLLVGDVDSDQPSAVGRFKDVVTVEGLLDNTAVDVSQYYAGSMLQTSVSGTAYTFHDIPPLGVNPPESATSNRIVADYESRFVDRIQITYAVGESLEGRVRQSIFVASGMAAGCQLSGTTFDDQIANDVFDEGSETGLSEVAISLYLDDGDNVFEVNGDDLFIETQDTGSRGNYLFSNLAENSNYWVDVNTADSDLDGWTYGGGDVDLTQTVPRLISIAASDVGEVNFPFDPSVLKPNIALVKRITAINRGQANERLFDTAYVDVGSRDDEDNAPEWPTNYLNGVVDGGSVQAGDVIEYTIYFLSNGGAAAQDFRLCDRIPDYLTFVDNAYGADAGILLDLANDNTSNNILTNSDDSDKGAYISTNSASLAYCGQDISGGIQDQGFVAVSIDNVPTASNNSQGAYGFMRFHAQVQ